jgi:predicted transcriptional regulator
MGNERRFELERLMKEQRYNFTSLSKKVGIDRSTLSHIVAGRDTYTSVFLSIAKALGTTIEKIF